jgi:hypothetical protein
MDDRTIDITTRKLQYEYKKPDFDIKIIGGP